MPLFSRKSSRPVSGSPDRAFRLDRTLLRLSAKDNWAIADACEGTQILGATGSGKTSGSGQAIAKAMLSSGFGGIVLTAKPDERQLWERYAAETGRSDSLLIFGIDEAGGILHRFNFLDYELNRDKGAGLTENLVALFTTVLEAAEGGGGQSSSDPFWPRALRQLLRNTIELLVLARGRVSLTDMTALVASAPQHPDDFLSEHWRESSHFLRCLMDAERRTTDPGRREDLRVTARYWCEEFPGMAERTRSSVVATFTTMADGLIRGALRELFCTTTTVTPELTHRGVILIIDLPVKKYHEVGRFAQILWKYCWQRATEGRDTAANPRPVFLWADEAQLFITGHDVEFQGTARSARACTVYLTQNLPSYYTQIGGANPKAATDAILGVLQTKIMHANGDPETNEWAERTVAKEWAYRSSSSRQPGGRDQRGFKEKDRYSTSANPNLENKLLAQKFTRLRKGGPPNKGLVDAVVFQGGRVWKASRTNFIETTFRQ
jgi:hypothetical protein